MQIKGSNYFEDLGMGMCMSICIMPSQKNAYKSIGKDHTNLLDIRKAKMKVAESCR
jgi:hypothetical protein